MSTVWTTGYNPGDDMSTHVYVLASSQKPMPSRVKAHQDNREFLRPTGLWDYCRTASLAAVVEHQRRVDAEIRLYHVTFGIKYS